MLRRSLVAALAVAACSEPGPLGNGLSVTPDVVDFGEVVVGLLQRRTLTLVNQTPEVVRVIEARPSDAISDAIRLERVPAAVVAGVAVEVEIVFAPLSEGTLLGSIEMLTDANPPELTVEVSGVAVAPFLIAMPESIDFGRVMTNDVAVWTATVTNRGTKPVTIDSIAIDMDSQREFEIAPHGIETLAFGESFAFDVRFIPKIAGRSAARLVVADDSPRPVPLSIGLLGEGVDGDLEVDPTNIDFTGALVGEERVRSFEIRNIGTATHTIDSIEIVDDEFGAFSIATSTSSIPFQLGPSDERSISVRFAPELAIAHIGTVLIFGTAVPSPRLVYVGGTASAPPVSQLGVKPRAIDFGGVELGSSAVREMTLESIGFLEVHISTVEIDPPTAPFVLVRPPMSGATLDSLDSHTFEVVFQPESEGVAAATLRVESDAANAPTIEVPLAGRGETTPSADADLRPTWLEFGYVPRDLDAIRTIILFNGGTAPLSIVDVELTEDASGRFSTVQLPDTSPFAPGESRSIPIRYSDPLGLAVAQTGTIAISTDDPDRPLILAPLLAHTTSPRSDEDADIRVHADGLDLHLLRADGSLFDRPSDCCWCNPNPGWFEPLEHRPFLDYDSAGGQTIRLSRADGSYGLEVHSRSTELTTVEVTIWLYAASPIVRSRVVGPGQRWRVGTIFFSNFDRTGNLSTANLPLDTPVDDACF